MSTLLDRMGYLALALALSLSTTVEADDSDRCSGPTDRKCVDQDPGLAAESPRVFGSRQLWSRAVLADPLTEATTPGNGPETSADCGFSLRAWCRRDGLPRLRVDATHSRVVRFPCIFCPGVFHRCVVSHSSRGIDRPRRCWRVIRTHGRGLYSATGIWRTNDTGE